jgi:glycosyltransferase involved in cell wall biosynthesis
LCAASEPNREQLRISLVVCTYNRADILPRCLEAACAQTLAPKEYEIVAVDNASTDNTAAIVRAIAKRGGTQIRYLYEPRKGLSHARNAGTLAARAPVVCYIDDDAIAARHLLFETVRVFDRHPGAGCVGGRIDLCLPPALPWWYSDLLAGYFSRFTLGFDRVTQVVEMHQYPFGANISFRKSALEAAGRFNASLGRIGKDFSGGEEIEAACKIARLGWGIYYTPFAAVQHCILPGRIRWEHIAKSAAAAGRNWAYYDMELFRKEDLGPDVRLLAGTLFAAATAVLGGSLTRSMFAYSNYLFAKAKLMRKIRYRLRGGGTACPAES